ncbi:hypothetical protein SPWS13_2079 [Shewanella putrefaciens]|nr:hypothetical protein SPWS13_2079 [Shewanella putrefaciens]
MNFMVHCRTGSLDVTNNAKLIYLFSLSKMGHTQLSMD